MKLRGIVKGCATAALIIAWFPLILSPPAARAGSIVLSAPRDGAIVAQEKITLSGREDSGATALTITVNGREVGSAPVQGGAFTTSLTLTSGENWITLRSPKSLLRLVFEYRPKGGEGTYRFHAPYEEGDCAACHAGGRPGSVSRTSRSHSQFCHNCHDRKDKARFLHGPVGAGQCIFCHDPHGSPNPAFVTAPGSRLCLGCHDQPSSQSHLKSASGRTCEECHNAHGSSKKFFLN